MTSSAESLLERRNDGPTAARASSETPRARARSMSATAMRSSIEEMVATA